MQVAQELIAHNVVAQSVFFKTMTAKYQSWVPMLRALAGLTVIGLLVALVVVWASQPTPDPWQEVRELILHGNPERAGEKMRELDPAGNNWRTHWLRARMYRYVGKMAEARIELQEAAKLGGDIETLEREQLFCLAVSGQVSRAEGQLNRLLLDPRGDAAEIARSYTLGYYLAQRFKEANQMLKAWRDDEPNNAEPWFLQGLAFDFTDHTREAVEAMRKGLELDPSRWRMRLVLAGYLEAAGEFDDAFAETEAVLAERPNEPEAIFFMGLLGLKFGELELAEENLEKLRHIPNVEIRLCQLEMQVAGVKLDWQNVKRWARRLLELRPNDVDAMTQLARALAAEGNVAEAEAYRERIQQNTIRLQSIQNLTDELGRERNQAELLIEIGDESRAADVDERGYHWYRAAVEVDPLCKRGHERLARYYREIGNLERAEEHERKAKQCPDRPVPPSLGKPKVRPDKT